MNRRKRDEDACIKRRFRLPASCPASSPEPGLAVPYAKRGIGTARNSEVVDFAEYEPKIQKLLDTHVGTGEIEQITPLVNIFDQDAFAREVEKLPSAAAKANTIAHRTARTIYERMQEDPAFYRRFSELLEATIRAFREKRIKSAEYLKKVTKIMNAVLNRTGNRIPEKLKNHDVAKAYFGVIKEAFERFGTEEDDFENALADIALGHLGGAHTRMRPYSTTPIISEATT